ncbi:unnamed protein product [Adineta steineri]|uniref:RNA helicase n=1 Tax=Adineta steineri TaxID=433720 RepID=A0A813VIG0_9BILA|nr:unnamed protein product [Adineta steineri]CAF3648138.1 unnamed protein product [Adineta steineri]
MLSLHKQLLRSSNFSGYTFKISSILNYSTHKRHRTSSNSPHHHHPSHRINPNKTNNQTNNLRRLFQPIDVKPLITTDKLDSTSSKDSDSDIGRELTGGKTLERNALLRVITDFYRRDEIKKLAADQGLDIRLFQDAYVSFRKFCIQSTVLPVDLHIVLSDIISGSGHVTDIFPYFLRHAREMFPHLSCMEDLKKISDLRDPANWYPDARAIQRKIIFHAGPTNSGKTYHALQRYMNSESGVYCGPLKLLASEVFYKTNAAGTKCDLVTGEERRFADPEGKPANHVACTVEMTNLTTVYDVAVIDEIQMMRDPQRGWAWTRALLGIQAKEIHLCGEASTIRLIQELMVTTGDDVEVREYKRLTKLNYQERALETFDNVKPGDCFVCFSKNDIFHITRELERRGHEVAVIYGSLPPGTKLLQAQRFNDPTDSCKIMVATDAIGMGLNLSIKRIIFYSLVKPQLNEQGEKEKDAVTTSQALQIAGRAGRFASAFPDGEVTTFRRDDLPLLKEIVSRQVETIKRAGLHPTAEQIEMFAYHLPKHSLSSLIDIFVLLSQLDDSIFFMCNVEDVKFLADIIEHVPLPLRARYTFSCAPINKKMPFVCTMFLKYARQYSRSEPTTFDWLAKQISWPFEIPNTIMDLVHLEEVFDCLDLYLWLSFRFADMFPDKELVRGIQAELDQIIHAGVQNIVKLIHRASRLEDAKDVAVTTSTTEKTAEVVAAISEETKSTNSSTRTNAPQIRSIIGLEEELDIDTTNTLTTSIKDNKIEKPQEKSTIPLTMNTHKVLHSYLNALKTQAETRGHEFNETEDLIKQLIAKGLLSQRSVDKLEKQLATFNDNDKKTSKKRETTKTMTFNNTNKKNKLK